ncbi:MAG: hypothetical protein Hyperionvirus48_3 [Hyperionvirus sp.]|uniref:Uncharacterized protein n=1 Tax=Hyperionvirus sp. TaxID=2487770 RepID=A0A3G5ACA9_9VIRU|nr:MAG: hypothetical protein Hyperionvirus48_3 [Hyperionvirus sp.]
MDTHCDAICQDRFMKQCGILFMDTNCDASWQNCFIKHMCYSIHRYKLSQHSSLSSDDPYMLLLSVGTLTCYIQLLH